MRRIDMAEKYYLVRSDSGVYFINKKTNKRIINKSVIRSQVYIEHYQNRIIAWCLLLCQDGTVFWTNKEIKEDLLRQDISIEKHFFVDNPFVKMKGEFLLSMFDSIKYGFSWLSYKHKNY